MGPGLYAHGLGRALDGTMILLRVFRGDVDIDTC